MDHRRLSKEVQFKLNLGAQPGINCMKESGFEEGISNLGNSFFQGLFVGGRTACGGKLTMGRHAERKKGKNDEKHG